MLDIYGSVLAVMKLRYGSDPADIIAGISPMISAANYPVKEDFLEKLKAFYPDNESKRFLTLREGRHFFSLRGLLRSKLETQGVSKHEFIHLCTYSEKEMFYSWRREGEKTGRFGLIAMLR